MPRYGEPVQSRHEQLRRWGICILQCDHAIDNSNDDTHLDDTYQYGYNHPDNHNDTDDHDHDFCNYHNNHDGHDKSYLNEWHDHAHNDRDYDENNNLHHHSYYVKVNHGNNDCHNNRCERKA
mmetsp:Transcript_1140/g.3237  ORF Transcript_1140/g.3237 Transcript_1140/m.3237 type:complete len:122 (+) Transcript_1140:295-660(+)